MGIPCFSGVGRLPFHQLEGRLTITGREHLAIGPLQGQGHHDHFDNIWFILYDQDFHHTHGKVK